MEMAFQINVGTITHYLARLTWAILSRTVSLTQLVFVFKLQAYTQLLIKRL